ncbi:MAG: prephenate dehydrogenase/arogenate dehydrogenase family protein [Holophagaceae bacterium]|nr:prephenate dehydrogenase/arogenate dehydrogenase family protein [Holophagaceae bacterium]
MERVGIIGFGRFGAAFAGLCGEQGWAVAAYDTARRPPEPFACEGLAELMARSDLLVLATPVPRLPEVLRELRPHLRPGHWVMDVGSVKVRPVEVMEAALGRDCPWVATHPLFGPVSLAQAERPLRVVVCPNALHPELAAKARSLYERLGCEVIEQEAHAHDRAMATTHALAFFVAKGLLDSGAGEDVEAPPPSFQALARSIALVRGDAGHLFRVLQLENPYARAARRRLLGALQSVDRALEEDSEGSPSQGPGTLDIASPVLPAEDLRSTRDLIDAVDRELLALLERRARLALRAARAKGDLGVGILDPDREARLLEERRRWAEERGLDPRAVEDLFQLILSQSRALQAT